MNATAPDALSQRILNHLKANPGQKAGDLARSVGATREEVNRKLYGPLKTRVKQDRSYRWYLADDQDAPTNDPERDTPEFANTPLAKLARYYLACLGYDEAGVSTFLTSKFGDPDWTELEALPRPPTAIDGLTAARSLLGRKRSEQGRYGLYLGYPTALTLLRSKRSDWTGYMVEPILLFPVEQDNGRLFIDLNFPIINQKPFQRYTHAERDQLMNELVQLEQELGLGAEGETIEIDELAMRLQAVRPEWPWREQINPDELGTVKGPLGEVADEGIFNRAYLILAEKSPFTQGLEQELRELAKLPEANYANTALGNWLRGDPAPVSDAPTDPEPLLEMLPMNSEQRQAESAALSRPMTVITGPPGTGKSQVVTNLLANAAWRNKRILFASKNNKAVDIVEILVNTLGPRPILLRVGSKAYQVKLAEYVLGLLASTTTKSEQEDFEEAKDIHQRLVAKHRKLNDETVRIVELRNEVDRLERTAEEARTELGEALFRKAPEIDPAPIKAAMGTLAVAIDNADQSKAPFFTRLFWSFAKKGRITALRQAIGDVDPVLAATGCPATPTSGTTIDLSDLRAHLADVDRRLKWLADARTYLAALAGLQASRSLEDVSRDEAKLQEQIAAHSLQMWKLWLRIQPSRLSYQDRQRLGRYTAMLQMVIEAGADGELSKQAYGQYASMLKDVSYLLPCWAVTNLSARGKIPFEPGTFDLVVFDEASQCDIASALSLLYRAKAVAVIGDPKQLSHISSLQRGQDQSLLEKFGLIEDYPQWSYAMQTLFGLAALQVHGEDIVGLVDHHRSHADIIDFSNREFYEERLRVATRYDRLKRPAKAEPGIRWIDVKGNCQRPGAGGAVNRIEAQAVAEALKDLVFRKGYEGSLGVVTPFRAQANAITEAVNADNALASRLIQHGFIADTVHKFQGDERDLMIFSPVITGDPPPGAVAFLKANGNLFNVAITRARAQLLVVGDRLGCGKSDIGYLSRFASYVGNLDGRPVPVDDQVDHDLGPAYPQVPNPHQVSDWERVFYPEFYKAGLRPIPQYPIERFIADFVVVNGERRLVIEVDGERYHRNWTGELCRRDQIRNQRMFELGYDVMRFWVYEIRDDMKGCVKRVEEWIDAD
ncbi:AAA domain-containing protein [Sandarakinorhabdus rubra]|uniref:AAA domain-containing protein n=1 Tax=Sandarakinorhabdus rubra TaxID=2672568 RepID=UPI0013D99053|nr:AAA domain-containing protein [Sandarakinorhabdus rubra]